jgi:hypothetical protein
VGVYVCTHAQMCVGLEAHKHHIYLYLEKNLISKCTAWHVVQVDYTCQTVKGPDSGLEDKRTKFSHKDCVLKSNKYAML